MTLFGGMLRKFGTTGVEPWQKRSTTISSSAGGDLEILESLLSEMLPGTR